MWSMDSFEKVRRTSVCNDHWFQCYLKFIIFMELRNENHYRGINQSTYFCGLTLNRFLISAKQIIGGNVFLSVRAAEIWKSHASKSPLSPASNILYTSQFSGNLLLFPLQRTNNYFSTVSSCVVSPSKQYQLGVVILKWESHVGNFWF